MSDTYTTRSYTVSGIGANTGLEVVTKAVNGVVAGQELWFPNTGFRNTNGTVYTSHPAWPPGQGGYYLCSNENIFGFTYYPGYYTGCIEGVTKLWGCSVRCVR